MAALGHTVDSGSGASGDYASLNALEAAQEQDLTDGGGDTYTATCTTTGDKAADTTAVTLLGWTTGAANYISFEAASADRASASGIDANKYRLALDPGDRGIIDISEDYVRLVWLQISGTYAGHGHGIKIDDNGTSEYRIEKCFINAVSVAGANFNRGISIETTASTRTINIFNSIISGWGALGANQTGIYQDGANTTTNIYNCTIEGCYNGILQDSGTMISKNNAVFNNTDDFNGTITIDYCASDDNDGTNNVAESGGGANWPDDFEGAGSGDFRLKSGSNLVDGGTDNPGSGLYSDDIEGTARGSPWDVGAFEYVAPAAGGIVVLRRRRM